MTSHDRTSSLVGSPDSLPHREQPSEVAPSQRDSNTPGKREAKSPKWTAERLAAKRVECQRRKESGECVECRAKLQEDDGMRCVECAEVARISLVGTRKRAYDRRAKAGMCTRCGAPRLEGIGQCARHAEQHRQKNLEYRRRRRAGIVPIRRAVGRPEPEPIELNTRERVLRALSHFDSVGSRELFHAMGIQDFIEGGDNCARNTATQALCRLVKIGWATRSGNWGVREYAITPAGRLAVREKLDAYNRRAA